MSIYNVTSDKNLPVNRIDGVDAYLVHANSAAEAKALAKGAFDGDSDAVWEAASAAVPAPGTILTGWVFNITVGAAGANANVTVTGDSDDTIDDIGAKLVTALNATAIDNAAYNTGTNVLTIAGSGDNLGDKARAVTVTPPAGLFKTGYTWPQTDLVTSLSSVSTAGTAISVTFATGWIVPSRITGYKQPA